MHVTPTTQYVEDSVQFYLDLQTGMTVTIITTIAVACVPIAFVIWSLRQRAYVLATVGVLVAGVVVLFGSAIYSNYAGQADVEIAEATLSGTITAVEGSNDRTISTVRLDTQERSLLVAIPPDDLLVGKTISLTCFTLDGAVAIYSPCTLKAGGDR